MSPPPQPRVLVVAPLYHTDRGGLGRQAVLLTERVAAAGARAMVATRFMEGLPARRFSRLVEVYALRAGRPDVHNYEKPNAGNLLTSLRFSARLLALMAKRRRDYDVIHVHGASLPFLLALPWARLLGKRVIAKVAALHQGVEAGDLRAQPKPLGPLLAWLASHGDAFVATTAEIAAALEAEGIPRERIARLPNFVDTTRFRPASAEERERLRREHGFEGRTVLLCAGRLAARKNVDLLLQAYASILPRLSEQRPLLAIAGDGPEGERLRALSTELGLGDAVRFVGFEERIERLYQAADAFVIASRVEGLPNALLESMGCGMAVIATALGGALDVISDGRDGILIPANEVEPLAQALERVLSDAELRERLGRGAHARIEAAYTLEAIAPRYLDLYERTHRRDEPAAAGIVGLREG